MTIILFAITIALITGVIMPILSKAKDTGGKAYQLGEQAKTGLTDVLK